MSLQEDPTPILAADARYSLPAYHFMIAALRYAETRRKRRRNAASAKTGEKKRTVRHVTGQQLSRAARDLALSQFGLLARTVLERWGIRSTSDFGELVYNLIEAGDLVKRPEDSRSDFDDVFDFAEAFDGGFTISTDLLGE